MYPCMDGQLPISTQTVSFPSSLQQLRGLHKNRSSHKLCAAGAWNRSSSKWSGYEVREHRVRGAYRGGSLNVCALDVGAFVFLLNYFCTGGKAPSIRVFWSIERADYIGRREERQGADCRRQRFQSPKGARQFSQISMNAL